MSLSNKEILEKAIQKAIDGGWRVDNMWVGGKTTYTWESSDYGRDYYFIKCKKYIHEKNCGDWESVEQLIFNHDFAKALWGEGILLCYECTEGRHDTDHGYGIDRMAEWQYELQQMVIAEDPIKYLGDNI